MNASPHGGHAAAAFLRGTTMARMAFSTAITMTPTSAKMANHMSAMPKAPKMRQDAFTPTAMTIFCLTMEMVFLAIYMA